MPEKRPFLSRLAASRVPALSVLAAIAAASAAGAVLADQVGQGGADTGAGRANIERIVREYILANPEIIPEAMTRLQNREATRMLASNRKEIETPFAGAVAGNPDGDVSLVVFFDYACPFCRQGASDVSKLIQDDKKVKVVFRDFPVLSPESEVAAMASLSAASQGKYLRFHDAMFKNGARVTRERTIATVRAAGLDERRTAADLNAAPLKAEIKRNLDLGRALGLSGTPSYIVGDRILSGAVGLDALKAAVAEARESGTGG
ncbi:DsbA family protein [Polymorphobacter sp.]|uniref:DsbA family protein n=1 Tax=Polymorphobacter sp. TaxID=1909290 RepID=UPI003F6F8063